MGDGGFSSAGIRKRTCGIINPQVLFVGAPGNKAAPNETMKSTFLHFLATAVNFTLRGNGVHDKMCV